MWRWVIAAAGLCALGGIGFAAYQRGHGADDLDTTVAVERGPIERIVVASGTIEPEHLVEVRAKVSGIVQRFAVGAGDRVKAGQVVAELDRETLEAAVREARSVLREADRIPRALELARRQFEKVVGQLDRALDGNDYLVESRFTAADLMAGYAISLARMVGELPESPRRVHDWFARLSARPAFERAFAGGFGEAASAPS